MAHIPKDAIWYIAEIIEEIVVQGELHNIVHRNFVLIRADSPQEAYEKALVLGRDAEISYENPAGKTVSMRFRGLGGLDVVHDELEDGAELFYEEEIGLPETEVEKLTCSKEELSVFRSTEPTKGPDYRARDIVLEAERLLGHTHEEDKQ